MSTRRDFLKKSSQLLTAGVVSGNFLVGCDGDKKKDEKADPNKENKGQKKEATLSYELPKLSYELPNLPYSADALEKAIDANTMGIHHGKHHKAYVDGLNKALKPFEELSKKPLEELLKNLNALPKEIKEKVQNLGGGHANHTLFWQIMSPNGGGEPKGSLLEQINKSFGDFTKFKDMFSKEALAVFGSGWAWLVINNNKLEITTTANQDTPIFVGKTPVLGIDVWEHAYYLRYQNVRKNYIDAWWNVVHWEEIAKRFSVS